MRYNNKLIFSGGVQKQASTDFFISCIQRYNTWGKEILKTIFFRCSLKIRGLPGGSDEEPSRLQSRGQKKWNTTEPLSTHTHWKADLPGPWVHTTSNFYWNHGAVLKNLLLDRKRSLKGFRGSDMDHLTGDIKYTTYSIFWIFCPFEQWGLVWRGFSTLLGKGITMKLYWNKKRPGHRLENALAGEIRASN